MRERFRVDWRLVRGIGQLHILNRASMFLLVFVPILAATWPVVRRLLESAFGTSEPMPATWAYLFASSLLLLVGRTIFQLGCPDVVKEFSLSEYVRSKKREYAEAPSLSAVTQAVAVLQERGLESELTQQELDSEARNRDDLVSLTTRLSQVEGELSEFRARRSGSHEPEEWDRKHYNEMRTLSDEGRDLKQQILRLGERDRGDRGPEFRRKMALVEASARHTYRQEAGTAFLPMVVCGLCYLAAIGFIVQVIANQATAVTQASGVVLLPW